MLARDAENLYWMARYLGRAENTARLIISTSDILLDLPQGASLGWGTVLQIAGIDHMYKKHYETVAEADIMHFLIADERNQSSILSSVQNARENTRTLRELLPEELWERINSLYLYIVNNIDLASKNRRNKYLFLQNVIQQRHSIEGLIISTLERDLAYYFIRLGTHIERADMTTRIMDINYAISLPQDSDSDEITRQTLWVGILKALSAFLPYRRLHNVNVNMAGVVDFLFHERRFPRSIIHCLYEIESTLLDLPMNEALLPHVKAAQLHIQNKLTKELDIVQLHESIDIAQQQLNDIHNALNETYFSPDEGAKAA
ncbi:MAG: alpha-E domain-containing protein [Methylophilus sp.]|nr:alpha-E domain-containing protein [Methylophilus sp.]